MSVYVVVDIGLNSPSDQSAFGSYVENTNELLSREGVKVIAFDPAPEVLEGNWAPRMIVIQEYPDMETVKRVQSSDAYAPLKILRQKIADTNVIVVNGT